MISEYDRRQTDCPSQYRVPLEVTCFGCGRVYEIEVEPGEDLCDAEEAWECGLCDEVNRSDVEDEA